SPTELRLQLELLGIDLHQGRVKGAIPSARRMLALAHEIGEEQGRAHLLLGRALDWVEGSAEALEHYRAGSFWAERAGDGALSLYADVNTAVTLLMRLETKAARSLFARTARRARRLG